MNSMNETQSSSSLSSSWRDLASRLVQTSRQKKRKIFLYTFILIGSALILTHLFANHYDGSKLKLRGEARRKRQVPANQQQQQQQTTTSATTTPTNKDPFASRPRITTRNGHLMLESGQDKNIEFKTGGSRGSVVLNGLKLDQLFGLARAFDSSSSKFGKSLFGGGGGAAANGTFSGNISSVFTSNSWSQLDIASQYDLLLENLFKSVERLQALDKSSKRSKKALNKTNSQLAKVWKRLGERSKVLSELRERHNDLLNKLKTNECFDEQSGQSVCKNGATCIDLYGSFKCLCPKEFEGQRCELDVDECSKLQNTDLGCQNGAKCINLPGSYKCECLPQWHGVHCTERHDDCSLASAGSLCGHGKCVNLARQEPGRPSYECICDQGWTSGGGGGGGGAQGMDSSPACVIDVNECLAGQFLGGEQSSSLMAANNSLALNLPNYPCSTNPFVDCINLPGSFQCGPCPPGYAGNGRLCRDIDECRDGQNGGCSQVPLVECINLPGKRTCGPCPAGYVGDGQQCDRVPPCLASPNGGCHPAAKCVQLNGAQLSGVVGGGAGGGGGGRSSVNLERICECQYPFVGNGIGPDGCLFDRTLAIGTLASANSADNLNNNNKWAPMGDYSATFSQAPPNSSKRQQQPQDDCHPNPCLNGATCRQVDAVSFECSCPDGFSGRLCEQTGADLICGGQLQSSSGALKFPPGGSVDSTGQGETKSWYEQLLAKLTSSTSTTDQASKSYRKQMHTCTWLINSALSNMSLKLDFFNLLNKINPNQLIRVQLFNGTSSIHTRQHLTLPGAAAAATSRAGQLSCEQNEHLDVYEQEPVDDSNRRRLIARFCVNDVAMRPLTPPSQKQKSKLQLSSIMIESNRAQLEYTFPLNLNNGRPSLQQQQQQQPALSFELNWQPVEPACGGVLPISSSGSLESPKFPQFYSAGIECRYFVRVPIGNRIRLQFGELTLLTNAAATSKSQECIDSLTLLDGATGSHRPILAKYCGNKSPSWHKNTAATNSMNPTARNVADNSPMLQLQLPEPVISSSSTIELVLSSQPDSSTPLMRPKQKGGFMLTYSAEPQQPGCGGLFTSRSALIKSFDYEPSMLQSAGADELQLANEYARYNDFKANISSAGGGSSSSSSSSSRDYISGLAAWRDAAAAAAASAIRPDGQGAAGNKSPPPPPRMIRCEFEIRPGDRARNHQIELNWLEMPSDALMDASSMRGLVRRARCLRAKLSLYERQDNVSPPLATFCSGDRFNASLDQLARPLVTSGHALFLVYESSTASSVLDLMSAAEGHPGAAPMVAAAGAIAAIRRPSGFKLHYSTKCSATYRQLEGTIITELDLDNQISECLYHLMLPENNTISLLIEPMGFVITPEQSGAAAAAAATAALDAVEAAAFEQPSRVLPMKLADGSCAVQAILLDGVKLRSNFELNQLERQLQTFEFHQTGNVAASSSGDLAADSVDISTTSGQQQAFNSGQDDPLLGQNNEQSNSDLATDSSAQRAKSMAANSSTYWQYANSNQVNDIKEFDVCHWPAMAVDSMWNHMSLLFRLNPKLIQAGKQQQQQQQQQDENRINSKRLQVRIRYRAERSCGGILSDRQGKIELTMMKLKDNQNKQKIPTTTTTQQMRQTQPENCAWILKNPIPNQPIQLEFNSVPVDEIKRRQSAWIKWIRSKQTKLADASADSQQTKNKKPYISAAADLEFSSLSLGVGSDSYYNNDLVSGGGDGTKNDDNNPSLSQEQLGQLVTNCSLAFVEIIELFEASVNRTRFICPPDLLDESKLHWLTQSDTVFVRLLNSSSLSQQLGANQSALSQLVWPERRPLYSPWSGSNSNKSNKLSLNYTMLTAASSTCGGRLLQAQGVIQTPRYPFNYPPSLDCVWVLQAPNLKQKFRLNFTKFETEKQTSCWFDYLELRNGPLDSSPLIGRFCNQQLQSRVLISQSSFVWLRFKSDAHMNRQGFRLEFDAAETGCGGHLTSATGEIDSPNYPNAYLQSADCEWTIEVAQGNVIQLSVDDLDLSGTSSVGGARSNGNTTATSGCSTQDENADYLEIFDAGSTSGSGSLLLDSEQRSKSLSGRLCRKPTTPTPNKKDANKQQQQRPKHIFVSSSNTMRVVYRSQAQDIGRGFSLSYQTLCQLEFGTSKGSAALSGVIESPGYPFAYLPRANCLWFLRGPLGSRLAFNVADLELEHSGDDSSSDRYLYSPVGYVGASLGGSGTPIGGWRFSSSPLKRFRGVQLDAKSGSSSGSNSSTTVNSCYSDQLQIWSVENKKPSNTLAETLDNAGQNETLSSLPIDAFHVRYRDIKDGKLIKPFTNMTNSSIVSMSLKKVLCGGGGGGLAEMSLKPEDRSFELDTNRALVSFVTDQALEMRGFRLEWRAVSPCGGQQLDGDHINGIVFDERSALASVNTNEPLECLWIIDLSRNGRTLEVELDSDMRSPQNKLPLNTASSVGDITTADEACKLASLTVYDGLNMDKAPILARNCRDRRPHQTFFAYSGTILIRYYVKQANQANRFGRNFALYGWPSSRDGCTQSVFDINAPFGRPALTRQSPNYPDLYEAKRYRCSALLASSYAGRLRLTIEELDIPAKETTTDSDSTLNTGLDITGSLQTGETCEATGNYLLIRRVGLNSFSRYLCGSKFDRSQVTGSSPDQVELRAKSVVISDTPSVWLDFKTTGKTRGKWRVSVDRLCGSFVSSISGEHELSTPNFPKRPEWASNMDASPSSNEKVCIWRLSTAQTNWLNDRGDNRTNNAESTAQQFDKIHLSMIQFSQSSEVDASSTKTTAPTIDCFRVYEGISLDLQRSKFNLTDLDARFEPKMRLCKQTDLSSTKLSYTSQGSEIFVLTSGSVVAKFRVKPYDNHCGGEYQFSSAEFASPGFPQAYKADLDCHYFVLGSPGSRIALKFLQMDLPEPEVSSDGKSCDNVDHIEVRQLSFRKRVDIRLRSLSSGSNSHAIYSGTLRDNMIANKLLPVDSMANNSLPLMLNKNNAKSTNLNDDQLQRIVLQKLDSTRQYLERMFELSKLYMLTDDMGQESSGIHMAHLTSRIKSTLTRLTIKLEDFYEHSTLIGRFCGSKVSMLSELNLRDEILVRFRTFGSQPSTKSEINPSKPAKNYRGFLAKYSLEYGGNIHVQPTTTTTTTTSTSQANTPTEEPAAAVLRPNCQLLGSPKFPTLHNTNQTIVWEFSTQPGYVLEFDLVSLSLTGLTGQLSGGLKQSLVDACSNSDVLQLFDGHSQTAPKLADLCGHLSYKGLFGLVDRSIVNIWSRAYNGSISFRSLPIHNSNLLLKRFRSSSNVATLVYDNWRGPGQFLMHYCAIKSLGSNESSIDVNKALDYDVDKPISISELELEEQQRLASSASQASLSCSKSIQLTPNWIVSPTTATTTSNNNKTIDQIDLTSPGWPQEVNDKDIECHWHLFTRENTNIKLAIDLVSSSVVSGAAQGNLWPNSMADPSLASNSDLLNDLDYTPMDENFCFNRWMDGASKLVGPTSFVIVHDGSSPLAPIMARFCLPAKPIELISSGRHMFVRYVHTSNNQQIFSSVASSPETSLTGAGGRRHMGTSLFKAKARVSQCGGQYHVTFPMTLKDRRGTSKFYSNNLDCSYQIFANTLNQVLNVHFSLSELNLAKEPTNVDCSVGDYFELRDLPILTGSSDSDSDWTDARYASPMSSKRSGRLLGRYCAGNINKSATYFETPGPGLEIYFHTDAANSAAGWSVFLSSSEPHVACPSSAMTLRLESPFGYISSPNWPHGFAGRRRCKFNLMAPLNKAIEWTFVRLNRPVDTQSGQCLDNISYLADNEAATMRYSTGSLRELRSPVSGQLMRQLVQEVNCSISRRVYAMTNARSRQQEAGGQLGVILSKLSQQNESLGATNVPRGKPYSKISADIYESINAFSPVKAIKIITQSHVLRLEYSADSLMADEGFLAIYKLVDPVDKCGGQISSSPGKNLIESSRFGQKMLDSDPYIQCEWKLHFERSWQPGASALLDSKSLKNLNRNLSSIVQALSAINDDQRMMFSTSSIVFQTIELPPQIQNTTVFEQDWSFLERSNSVQASLRNSPNELCGLNRLLITDFFSSRATLFACGYWQPAAPKWILVNEISGEIHLRTKNLERVVYDRLPSMRQRANNDLTNPAADHDSDDDNNSVASETNVGHLKVFRGLRAYFHETECYPVVQLQDHDSILIRSHRGYSSRVNSTGFLPSSYKPGICRWRVHLTPGYYEISLLGVNLRNATTKKLGTKPMIGCDLDQEPTMDYIDLTLGGYQGSPLVARICANNQAKLVSAKARPLHVAYNGYLNVHFVAGLDKLAANKLEFDSNTDAGANFGFEMLISKQKNITVDKFCHASPQVSIYSMIRNRDRSYLIDYGVNHLTTKFLYPKNVHCEIDLVLDDEDSRYNLTFVNVFDIEQSSNCSADYVGISDFVPTTYQDWAEKLIKDWRNAPTSTTPKSGTTTRSSSKGKKKPTTTLKPTTTSQSSMTDSASNGLFSEDENSFVMKPIGRWCGKTRPKGWFISKSNRVRITFHSNDHIEGKGFILEWATVPNPSLGADEASPIYNSTTTAKPR